MENKDLPKELQMPEMPKYFKVLMIVGSIAKYALFAEFVVCIYAITYLFFFTNRLNDIKLFIIPGFIFMAMETGEYFIKGGYFGGKSDGYIKGFRDGIDLSQTHLKKLGVLPPDFKTYKQFVEEQEAKE
jgi:hypothetical protein